MARPTRRDFVRGGSAALAGLPLAAAQEGKDRVYRVAVIGSTGRGNYGHGLDVAWKSVDRTRIVAVADDDPGGLDRAKARLGVDTGYADYRKMIAAERPDIVAVCQRWIDRHREMAVAAAGAGAHVYMEKPFVPSLEDADAVAAACRKHGVKLALGHPTRTSPMLGTVKKLIADGAIGRVLEYRARGKEDARGGGEDLWVLGTHMLDLMRGLAGPAKWCFASVRANGRPVTRADVGNGNEGIGPLAGDSVHAMYGMSDGAILHFDSERRMAGQPSRYGLQIFGSKGILEILEGPMAPVYILQDPSWSPGRTGRAWQKVSTAGIGRPEVLTDAKVRGRYTMGILDFLDAIEKDREPTDGVREGVGVTEMIAAVFESHRLGGPVTLPLENRRNPLTLLK